ncbi:7TM GPCR domain containing protein [Aphelenchoides fujianensis]|nr:7TM GPCR domain containing protein [Aphelenchoides fujianensis]
MLNYELESRVAASLLFPVFVFGLCGSVLTLCHLIYVLYRTNGSANEVFRSSCWWLLILCLSDVSYLATLPTGISYFLLDTRGLGFPCKAYFLAESVARQLSLVIVAMMSSERYFVVCRPFVLCSPLYFYVEGYDEFIEYERFWWLYSNNPKGFITVCWLPVNDYITNDYFPSMFFLVHLLPAFVIFACYFAVLRRLRENNKRFDTAHTRAAIQSTLEVTIFHFVCWTPYWINVLLIVFKVFDQQAMSSFMFMSARWARQPFLLELTRQSLDGETNRAILTFQLCPSGQQCVQLGLLLAHSDPRTSESPAECPTAGYSS